MTKGAGRGIVAPAGAAGDDTAWTWPKSHVPEHQLSSVTAAAEHETIGRKIIDDRACFILCRGALEVEIDDVCRAAVNRRRTHPDWQVRRAWDLDDPGEPRFSGLSFENRARLVLDGQGGRASPYALTIKHYGSRNQIAHGELRATRIDVSAFVTDRYRIQSALHRAS